MAEKRLLLGAHASMAKGFMKGVEYIDSIGGNSVQVFLKSSRGRHSKPLDEADAQACREFVRKKGIFLVGHCSYLLNFARDCSEDSWPVDSLVDDMLKISRLGGVGVVLHVGKYLDMEKEIAFENIRKAVSEVLRNTPAEVKVIFENTAGQGSEIGFMFEELKDIYERFNAEEKKRIGFCLDTCHSFAAGYDLSTPEGAKGWMKKFDKLIGWDKVICIHFNDSKSGPGSRKDRHEDLAHGMIGKEGLCEAARIALETGKPLILETTEEHASYAEQLEMIKKWIQ